MIKKLMICPYFGTLPPWFDSYLANIEMLKPLGYDWHITTNLKLFKERVGDILGIECPIVPGTGKVWDYRPAFGVLFAEELKRYDYWGHTDFDCVYGRVDRFVTDEFLGLATPRVERRRDPAVDPLSPDRCPMGRSSGDIRAFRCMLRRGHSGFHDFGERPDSPEIQPEAVSPIKNPLDIHSNHRNYMCGPWSLYRNSDLKVNNTFMLYPGWRKMMEDPKPTAWIEKEFTDLVDWASQQGDITRKYTHWQGANPHDTTGLRLNSDGALIDCFAEETREIMMFHFRHTKEYPKGVKFV